MSVINNEINKLNTAYDSGVKRLLTRTGFIRSKGENLCSGRARLSLISRGSSNKRIVIYVSYVMSNTMLICRRVGLNLR